MATYQRMMKIYERMKTPPGARRVQRIPVAVAAAENAAGEDRAVQRLNAYYDPTERTIKICYEWMDETETRAPQKVSPEGITRQEAIVGGFVGVLLHESRPRGQ